MSKKKRILVCPLNWGLGHAARCIPLIRELELAGAEVIIAADGHPAELLKNEFPHLQLIRIQGYNITYSPGRSQALKMILSAPLIGAGICREHYFLKKIIKDFSIDIVISDNRFGLWSKKVRSIFITHQVMIKCPPSLRFLEPALCRLNRFFISRYHECWIPDFPGENNLSGDLAHQYTLPANTYFIGPLSRFKDNALPASTGGKLLVILSGPEPQRSIFEKRIVEDLARCSFPALLVRGLPGNAAPAPFAIPPGVTMVPHLDSGKLREAFLSASVIICRGGYSSIMDLAALGRNAIFVPTPGQTEQEYLAEYFKKKKIFYSEPQEEFNLSRSLEESKKYNVSLLSLPHNSQELLKNRLRALLI